MKVSRFSQILFFWRKQDRRRHAGDNRIQTSYERKLQQSAVKVGLSRRFVFQHDNNPQQTSLLKGENNNLQKTKVNVIKWPAQNLDLNPIECQKTIKSEGTWKIFRRQIPEIPQKKKEKTQNNLLLKITTNRQLSGKQNTHLTDAYQFYEIFSFLCAKQNCVI